MVSDKTVHSGAKESYDYDSRGRLTDVTLQTNASPPVTLSEQKYAYDAASQIIRHIMNGVHTVYTYDVAGNLTEEWFDVDLNGTPTDFSDDTWTDRDVYNYDNVGNRTRKRVFLGGSSTPTTDDVYTYFAGNGDLLEKIDRNGSAYRTYSYDAMGRTTSVWKTGVGTTTYSYNEDSRLTGITYPGPSSDSMTYNGMGTRVSRKENGVTNEYIRNGVGVTDPRR